MMKNIKDFINRFANKRMIAVILVSVFAFCCAGIAFATNLGGITDKVEEFIETVILGEDDSNIFGKSESKDDVKIKGEKEITLEDAIASTVLSEAFELLLEEHNDFDKITRNVKLIIAERGLDEGQSEVLEGYILSNSKVDVSIICSLYDYFYENFFTEADMEEAILRYNRGESVQSILQSYDKKDDGYIPYNYPDGMIEYLIEKKNMQIDELVTLEILSHRGLVKFDDIVERISNGEKMLNICEEFKVLNKNCEISSVMITTDEVAEISLALGISEDDATKKIVSAKKSGVKDEDVLKHVKSNTSDAKAAADHYAEKFDGRVKK